MLNNVYDVLINMFYILGKSLKFYSIWNVWKVSAVDVKG